MHVDETPTDQLAIHSREVLREELDRVESVIRAHSLTGEDLSYWFARQRTLEGIIVSRAPIYASDASDGV